MSTEIGKVVVGKVTSITKFGAFIALETGETGLCHISEIANEYVENVSDFLKKDDEVEVKVISVDPKGKISLSIKQAKEPSVEVKKKPDYKNKGERPDKGTFKPKDDRPRSDRPRSEKPRTDKPRNDRPRNDRNDRYDNKGKSEGFGNRKPGFEDMLNSFIKTSDDKLRSVKKSAKGTRRGNGYNNKK